MIGKKAFNGSGFTLLEVIVTIVLVASLSGIMIALISDSVTKSSYPVLGLERASELNIVMANMTNDYYKCPMWSSGATYVSGSLVKPTPAHYSGHYYQASCSTCTQGSTEPSTWNISPSTTSDNNITWIDLGPLPQPADLKTYINDTSHHNYGIYYDNAGQKSVTYHILFNDIVNVPAIGTVLKVQIADKYYGTSSAQSQTLTAYFVPN